MATSRDPNSIDDKYTHVRQNYHNHSAIDRGQIQPALVIGMPIGFSHAPTAKRRLMAVGVPYITIQGSISGGLLAAVAANALIASLLEKPDCHCHLKSIE